MAVVLERMRMSIALQARPFLLAAAALQAMREETSWSADRQAQWRHRIWSLELCVLPMRGREGSAMSNPASIADSLRRCDAGRED